MSWVACKYYWARLQSLFADHTSSVFHNSKCCILSIYFHNALYEIIFLFFIWCTVKFLYAAFTTVEYSSMAKHMIVTFFLTKLCLILSSNSGLIISNSSLQSYTAKITSNSNMYSVYGKICNFAIHVFLLHSLLFFWLLLVLFPKYGKLFFKIIKYVSGIVNSIKAFLLCR